MNAVLAQLARLSEQICAGLSAESFDAEYITELTHQRHLLFTKLMAAEVPLAGAEQQAQIKALQQLDATCLELAMQHKQRLLDNIAAAKIERQSLHAYVKAPGLSGARLDLKGI